MMLGIGYALRFLGFTDALSAFWNIFAYLGMVLIIAGVVSARWRSRLFFFGPLVLLVYALFFLQSPFLTGLQLIITVSGFLNLLNIKKSAPFIVSGLAAIVYLFLLIAGQISGLWLWIGSFGLLGIGLAYTQLPRKRGFAIMAIGGLLVVIYAFALQIWIWFFLNLIFFITSLIELRKK